MANPTPLYLNGRTGTYMPLKEQVYSPTDDSVYANVSQSEYFANDELVIVMIGQEPTTTTLSPNTVPSKPGGISGINYGVIAGIVAAIIIVAVLLLELGPSASSSS